ncbi:MAG: IPT/TIG domain-containing protein [Vicinamibacterales bacterium]
MDVATMGGRFTAAVLVVYLLVVGLGASYSLVLGFDVLPPPSGEAAACRATVLTCHASSVAGRILAQAFFAGIVGSFLHAAQSLASYIGNGTFKASWAAWYLLRPWIGGILALAMAFAAQAGLIGGAPGNANVSGLVALGLLGGWFSKTTTDKLQEVFATLFKTDADAERTDKLTGDQPTVTAVAPSPVPVAATDVTVTGTGFLSGARVTMNDIELGVTVVSDTELTVDLANLSPRPSGDVVLVVVNPGGATPASDPFTVPFA